MHSRLDLIGDWRELTRKSGYRVEDLARSVLVTPRELERFFQGFGISPKAWMDQLRMQDAQQLIRRGMLIKEVALILGFKHPQHFARAYKRVVGSTPTTARGLLPVETSIVSARRLVSEKGTECRE